jgi:hypothetical protein
VIHWADKLARAALLAFAFPVRGATDTVARLSLRSRALLEELLLLARLIVVIAVVLLPLSLLRRLRRLLLRLRRCRLRLLHLRLLAGLPILLARSILAAPAPAAMPLSWRLGRLTVVRR